MLTKIGGVWGGGGGGKNTHYQLSKAVAGEMAREIPLMRPGKQFRVQQKHSSQSVFKNIVQLMDELLRFIRLFVNKKKI